MIYTILKLNKLSKKYLWHACHSYCYYSHQSKGQGRHDGLVDKDSDAREEVASVEDRREYEE